MEVAMTAANIVRFRTKPGRQQDFIEAHKSATLDVPGFRRGLLVQTGERTFCFVGEWDSMSSLASGREQMISILDTFRDTLEDLGEGLGVTDPVSGEVVVEVE
jgi:quinol monooxygenase YgiN